VRRSSRTTTGIATDDYRGDGSTKIGVRVPVPLLEHVAEAHGRPGYTARSEAIRDRSARAHQATFSAPWKEAYARRSPFEDWALVKRYVPAYPPSALNPMIHAKSNGKTSRMTASSMAPGTASADGCPRYRTNPSASTRRIGTTAIPPEMAPTRAPRLGGAACRYPASPPPSIAENPRTRGGSSPRRRSLRFGVRFGRPCQQSVRYRDRFQYHFPANEWRQGSHPSLVYPSGGREANLGSRDVLAARRTHAFAFRRCPSRYPGTVTAIKIGGG